MILSKAKANKVFHETGYRVLLFLLCTLMPISTSASSSDSLKKDLPAVKLVKTVAGDAWHLLSAPARMNGHDLKVLSSVALFNVGLIYAADSGTDDAFRNHDDRFYIKPAADLADLGDLYDQIGSQRLALGLSAVMLSGSVVFKDEKLFHTTLLMAESLVFAGTITYWSKRVFGRYRPYSNVGASRFSPFTFRNSRHEIRSFPSGHATAAFSMMSVLAKQYPQWWIRIPAYTVATSVAIQRIDDVQHWLSDVFTGGLIGYWVAGQLVSRHGKRKAGVEILPALGPGRAGLVLHF